MSRWSARRATICGRAARIWSRAAPASSARIWWRRSAPADARSSASTPSPTTTRGPPRSATSSSAAARRRLPVHRARPGGGAAGAVVRERRRRVPSGRKAGREDELGVDVREPTSATTCWATQRVFEAAVRQGVRVVFASSSSVYGDARAYPLREDDALRPVSPYGVSKLACEALATRVRAVLRPGRRRAALLLRLRAQAAAGHGVLARLRLPRRGPPVRRARQRAPDSGLHLRRRHRQRDPRCDGTGPSGRIVQHRRRL